MKSMIMAEFDSFKIEIKLVNVIGTTDCHHRANCGTRFCRETGIIFNTMKVGSFRKASKLIKTESYVQIQIQ